MRAAYAARFDADDPVGALSVGERPEPDLPGADWVVVDLRATALNHHDLWSLRGVGLRTEQLPMILGCDGAGIGPDGAEVVIYPVVNNSILSEHFPGTLADRVAVPRANLIPKPAGLSFADAACLPTAWLTAYSMLVSRGRVAEGDAVLVQGAGGGVATAAVVLGVALGVRVYATSRDAAKRDRIAALGAIALEPGARLPERVDVVIETVGAATFAHSMKCAKPGGRIVVCGATGGHVAEVDLRRLFALRLEILGTTMGAVEELRALLDLCVARGIRPVIDAEYGFSEVREAFSRLASGAVFGKVVLVHSR
ncbi:MAG TPA: zinc-binding dehydrogenase [Micromonosporaceae bacterium]|nr:zinc-binding dehydrogenase [Micromonosporaceae bacterium]